MCAFGRVSQVLGEAHVLTVNPEGANPFVSGFKRLIIKPRYDLVFQMSHALERLAKVRELGVKKYGENNWQEGKNDPEAQVDILNHAIEHLMNYKNGKTDKDHLAHAFCNIAFLLDYGCGEEVK